MRACRTLPLPILAFLTGALAIGCTGTGTPSPIEGQSPLTQPHRSALVDSLSALAAENMATWNRLDPDRWLGLVDDGVQWYYLDKRMDFAGVEELAGSVMPQLRESRTAIVGEPHVVVLGPDAAVVGFDAHEYWAPKADSIPLFERSTALTFVYQRISGEWKVVHVHESWAEPPAGDPDETQEIGYTFPSCDLPMEGPHGTSDLASRYVTMRDGVRIAVDVALPDPLPDGEVVPTVLIMTREWRGEEGQSPDRRARVFTSHGYALVVGDVRGTGASFGVWPHHRSEDETRDFVEIIDWIVEQPWSDGRVAGFGISYGANTADWMAARGHPALEAVVSRFPDFDPYVDLYFPGGVPNAYMGRERGAAMKEMDLNVKRPDDDGPRGVRPVDADSAGRLLAEAIAGRRDVPSVWEGLREVSYRDDQPESWHGASVDDWGTQNRTDEIERWGGPIQSWASWRDAGTANGVLNRFMTLDNPQRAFIGAWSHGGNHDADPYRPDSATARPPFMTQVLEDLCFLRWRFSDGSDFEPDRKLVYYTMGEGRWKTTTEWPPAGSELEPWYLSAESRLARAVPATGVDEYEVDFTATTGTTNRWATNNTGGDVRYGNRAEEDRKLLTYTSDPLPRDLEITGHPVATLHVASTHEDGAFFVYLEEIAPDGGVRYLTEGMLRALHRKVVDQAPPYEMLGPYHTFEREDGEPLVPGEVTILEFELMPLSVRVPAGHRLRVAIAGADADTFRSIPESGTPTISVHYGGERSSHVSLPVMRR